MPGYRSHRFLIDRIDAKLGDVRKEIKFDLIAMVVSAFVVIAGIVILCFSESKPVLVLTMMLLLTGVAVFYAMTKEFLSDYRRAKKEGKI